MLKVVWRQIVEQPDRWYGRSMGEIALAIYERCYVDEHCPETLDVPATENHIAYLDRLRAVFRAHVGAAACDDVHARLEAHHSTTPAHSIRSRAMTASTSWPWFDPGST